ncbi:hypothetical protein [Terrisporobacter mayombei]|nr:hypothetical protein [Terrisporobacter mayombei]
MNRENNRVDIIIDLEIKNDKETVKKILRDYLENSWEFVIK